MSNLHFGNGRSACASSTVMNQKKPNRTTIQNSGVRPVKKYSGKQRSNSIGRKQVVTLTARLINGSVIKVSDACGTNMSRVNG